MASGCPSSAGGSAISMTNPWRRAGRTPARSPRAPKQLGFDLTLIAELNLNDIKGVEAPSLDAWSTAAALAAVTQKLELMVAVRPTFHNPALLAKQAANIDQISGRPPDAQRRLQLVARRSHKVRHPLRRARPALRPHLRVDRRRRRLLARAALHPPGRALQRRGQRPLAQARPAAPLHRHSRRAAARPTAARPSTPAANPTPPRTSSPPKCDAYLMHGDPPEIVGDKIADMRARRERLGLPPMTFGVSGYAIVRDSDAEATAEVRRITDVKQSARGYENYQQWITGSKLEQKVSLEDYSVSNRGLRSGFVGTPEAVSERLRGVRSSRRRPRPPAIQPAGRRDGTLLRPGHPALADEVIQIGCHSRRESAFALVPRSRLSCPCDTTDSSSPRAEPHSPRGRCAPSPASHPTPPARCTPGSGWRSLACRASVRTLPCTPRTS